MEQERLFLSQHSIGGVGHACTQEKAIECNWSDRKDPLKIRPEHNHCAEIVHLVSRLQRPRCTGRLRHANDILWPLLRSFPHATVLLFLRSTPCEKGSRIPYPCPTFPTSHLLSPGDLLTSEPGAGVRSNSDPRLIRSSPGRENQDPDPDEEKKLGKVLQHHK